MTTAEAEGPRTASETAVLRSTTPERLRRLLAGDLETIVARALRKRPDDATAMVELADLLAARKQLDAALFHYRRALAQARGNAGIDGSDAAAARRALRLKLSPIRSAVARSFWRMAAMPADPFKSRVPRVTICIASPRMKHRRYLC